MGRKKHRDPECPCTDCVRYLLARVAELEADNEAHVICIRGLRASVDDERRMRIESQARVAELEAALRNVRRMATKMLSPRIELHHLDDIAEHLIRFCSDGGE